MRAVSHTQKAMGVKRRLLEDVLAGAREEGTLVAGLGSILDTVSEDKEDTAHLYL